MELKARPGALYAWWWCDGWWWWWWWCPDVWLMWWCGCPDMELPVMGLSWCGWCGWWWECMGARYEPHSTPPK